MIQTIVTLIIWKELAPKTEVAQHIQTLIQHQTAEDMSLTSSISILCSRVLRKELRCNGHILTPKWVVLAQKLLEPKRLKGVIAVKHSKLTLDHPIRHYIESTGLVEHLDFPSLVVLLVTTKMSICSKYQM